MTSGDYTCSWLKEMSPPLSNKAIRTLLSRMDSMYLGISEEIGSKSFWIVFIYLDWLFKILIQLWKYSTSWIYLVWTAENVMFYWKASPVDSPPVQMYIKKNEW